MADHNSGSSFLRVIRKLGVKGIYCLELIASILVVAVAIGMIVKIVNSLFFSGNILSMNISSFSAFLSDVLTITVGLEFVKLLARQKYEDIVEVVMLALARQMVVSHFGMKEMLIGVIALAVLFGINKYLLPEDREYLYARRFKNFLKKDAAKAAAEIADAAVDAAETGAAQEAAEVSAEGSAGGSPEK